MGVGIHNPGCLRCHAENIGDGFICRIVSKIDKLQMV